MRNLKRKWDEEYHEAGLSIAKGYSSSGSDRIAFTGDGLYYVLPYLNHALRVAFQYFDKAEGGKKRHKPPVLRVAVVNSKQSNGQRVSRPAIILPITWQYIAPSQPNTKGRVQTIKWSQDRETRFLSILEGTSQIRIQKVIDGRKACKNE
jgi:hypothetical protein